MDKKISAPRRSRQNETKFYIRNDYFDSCERDKYRNPPPPVVYVPTGEPRLVEKKADNEDNLIYILIQKLLDAKIYDIPNISQYEELIFNSSSDEDPITIKKDPEASAVTKDSSSVQTTSESKVQKHKKKHKERRVHLESHSRRSSKYKIRSSHSSDDDPQSESYIHDSDSKNRKLVSYSSDSSDDGSRSPSRKQESYVSDSKSHGRSRHKKKKNYYGGSDSHSRRHRKKSSSSEREKSGNQCKKSYECSSDSDMSNKNQPKKCYKYSSDSDASTRNQSKKSYKYSSHSDDDSYYKKEESHSKKPGAIKGTQSDFQKDVTASNSHKDRKLLTTSSFSTGHRIVKVKEEMIQNKNLESTFLHGDYHCKVCNVTSNNELTYESHLKGKKHKKAVENEQKDAQRALAKIPLITPPPSKYPKPALGYYRKNLDDPSVIQDFLDNSAKFPCPGLHKVTEIRGPTETVYYCAFCDCSCSYNSIIHHLSGYKHQLHSLKYYKSDLFESWNYKPKYQIQDKIIEILYKEQNKYGKGAIQVEKDFKDTDNVKAETEIIDWNIHDQPSTSYQSQDTDFYETYKFNSIPDLTKSGFYCKLCDSHSNSESMWSSHITGKRHLANLKKNPGLGPSKSKYVRAESNVQPILFKIIQKENEYNSPIVGLNQIRETRKPDINGVLFNCFLCGACVSEMEILNHIISSKHREKYLNSIKHPEMELLKSLQVSESSKSSILEEICRKVQENEGMGMPDVFFAKSSQNSF